MRMIVTVCSNKQRVAEAGPDIDVVDREGADTGIVDRGGGLGYRGDGGLDDNSGG